MKPSVAEGGVPAAFFRGSICSALSANLHCSSCQSKLWNSIRSMLFQSHADQMTIMKNGKWKEALLPTLRNAGAIIEL